MSASAYALLEGALLVVQGAAYVAGFLAGAYLLHHLTREPEAGE